MAKWDLQGLKVQGSEKTTNIHLYTNYGMENSLVIDFFFLIFPNCHPNLGLLWGECGLVKAA